MGYGLLQIGSGLEYLFDIQTGLISWIAIAIVITVVYTGTSVSGLKKELQYWEKGIPIFSSCFWHL